VLAWLFAEEAKIIIIIIYLTFIAIPLLAVVLDF